MSVSEKTAGNKNTNNTAQQVVERFLQHISDFNIEQAFALIADDCVYQNMPFHKAIGKKRVTRDLAVMAKNMQGFDVQMTHIATNGNAVLTERIDTITTKRLKADLEIMGVFIIDDEGKICEWRDYLDWTSMFGRFFKSVFKAK